MGKRWRSFRRSRRNALVFAFGSGYFLSSGLADIGWWTLGYVAISVVWLWQAWATFEGEAADA